MPHALTACPLFLFIYLDEALHSLQDRNKTLLILQSDKTIEEIGKIQRLCGNKFMDRVSIPAI